MTQETLKRKLYAATSGRGIADRKAILKLIAEELETWTIDQLRDACRHYGCNVSQLADQIYTKDVLGDLQ